jgi:hypothetical protein
MIEALLVFSILAAIILSPILLIRGVMKKYRRIQQQQEVSLARESQLQLPAPSSYSTSIQEEDQQKNTEEKGPVINVTGPAVTVWYLVEGRSVDGVTPFTARKKMIDMIAGKLPKKLPASSQPLLLGPVATSLHPQEQQQQQDYPSLRYTYSEEDEQEEHDNDNGNLEPEPSPVSQQPQKAAQTAVEAKNPAKPAAPARRVPPAGTGAVAKEQIVLPHYQPPDPAVDEPGVVLEAKSTNKSLEQIARDDPDDFRSIASTDAILARQLWKKKGSITRDGLRPNITDARWRFFFQKPSGLFWKHGILIDGEKGTQVVDIPEFHDKLYEAIETYLDMLYEEEAQEA